MTRVATRRWAVFLATTVVLAAGYVVAAKGAFALAFVHTSISPIWFPSGVALVAVMLFRHRAVPGVWLGAFLFNAATPVPLWLSGVIAVANTAEAVTGAFLLRRAGFRPAIDRVRDVLALGGLAALAATTVSATVGVGGLWAAGVVDAGAVPASWILWWSGDAVGVLTITPMLLLSLEWPRRRSAPRRVVEACCLAGALLLVAVLGIAAQPVGPVLVFPVLVWAAIRFHQLGASIASLFFSAVFVWATANGHGPFVVTDRTDNLLLTQGFVAVVIATSLLLAAMTVEREQVTVALQRATTELARRNRELELERSQLGEAQRLAQLGSWEWDVASGVVKCSDELTKILGLPPEPRTMTYLAFLGLVHPGDLGTLREMIANTLAKGSPYTCEHRIVRPDGQVRVMHARVVAVTDERGTIDRLIGVGQDVSEYKDIERALGDARDQALEASRAASRFLAVVSGEIRTRMDGVIRLSEQLLDGSLEPPQRRDVEEVRAASDALLLAINDVVDFSGTEDGKVVLDQPGAPGQR